jgi:heme exporter protein CcmD
MSYLIAAYGITAVSLALYVAGMLRERSRLRREMTHPAPKTQAGTQE